MGKIAHADFMTSRIMYHEDPADDGVLSITDKRNGNEIVRVNLPDMLSRPAQLGGNLPLLASGISGQGVRLPDGLLPEGGRAGLREHRHQCVELEREGAIRGTLIFLIYNKDWCRAAIRPNRATRCKNTLTVNITTSSASSLWETVGLMWM